MKKVLPVLNLLSNKYVFSVALFIVWISFFDRDDLLTQWDRKQELNKLETSVAFYEKEIAATKKDLTELNSDPAVLEKFAREKFYLKRPNEEIFLVDEGGDEKNEASQ